MSASAQSGRPAAPSHPSWEWRCSMFLARVDGQPPASASRHLVPVHPNPPRCASRRQARPGRSRPAPWVQSILALLKGTRGWPEAMAARRRIRRIVPNVPYRIEYSPEAEAHLRALNRRQQVTVLDSVDRLLVHQPTEQTRNRKPMRPNPLAGWELRLGELRVYYDVVEEPQAAVLINAVGVKDGNTVRIGGKVVQL